MSRTHSDPLISGYAGNCADHPVTPRAYIKLACRIHREAAWIKQKSGCRWNAIPVETGRAGTRHKHHEGLAPQHIGRQGGQSLDLAVSAVRFDRDITPLRVSDLRKPFCKREP